MCLDVVLDVVPVYFSPLCVDTIGSETCECSSTQSYLLQNMTPVFFAGMQYSSNETNIQCDRACWGTHKIMSEFACRDAYIRCLAMGCLSLMKPCKLAEVYCSQGVFGL